MALSNANVGNMLTVKYIDYGRKIKKKLLDMGLTPGTKFTIVDMQKRGPIIINVRGTKIIIGRGLAEKIIVESL